MYKKAFFRIFPVTFLTLLILGWNDVLTAQTAIPDSAKKDFGLFENDKPLEISLRFDLSTYFRTKPREDYLSANITFHLSKTDSISRDIKLRTRGVFRNQYCTFSPIELNFKKAKFGYSDLDKILKLKLVPECRSGSENEKYVLKEFLVYKLYNVLTDTSFRVRLLTVNYIDTQKKRKPIKQDGFIIEPIEMLIARTNSMKVELLTLNQKLIVPKIMDMVAIFNYMIGNYDWSVPGQHNIKIVKSLVIDSVQLGIAIPHDFDWTGMVNPSYAIPAENVGTQTVRERIFEGVCRTKEVYNQDLKLFLRKKDAFYKVINDFAYLSKYDKKDITGYLDEFYNQLEGRRDLAEVLKDSCKDF